MTWSFLRRLELIRHHTTAHNVNLVAHLFTAVLYHFFTVKVADRGNKFRSRDLAAEHPFADIDVVGMGGEAVGYPGQSMDDVGHIRSMGCPVGVNVLDALGFHRARKGD